MEISIFSYCAAVLCGSVMIFAVYLLRRNCFLSSKIEVSVLRYLYLFCLVRMLVPLEFRFTYVLDVKGAVSKILQPILWQEVYWLKITVLQLVVISATVVSGMLLMKFIWQYHKAMKEIRQYEKCDNKEYLQVLDEIVGTKSKVAVQLRFSERETIPFGIGLLRKSIVLPKRDYTQLELYYILQHEYTHFLNKDINCKMLIQSLCCIFWWNPMVYLLKRDLDQMLEIKCDLSCCSLFSLEQQIAYLHTIVETIKKAKAPTPAGGFYPPTTLFKGADKLTLVERFEIVSNNARRKGNHYQGVISWIAFSVLIFFASYLVLPQTAYEVGGRATGCPCQSSACGKYLHFKSW